MKISKFEKELHGTHSEPTIKLSSRSRVWYIALSIVWMLAFGSFTK